MANEYFKFRRVDNFDHDKNRPDCFTVDDMDGLTPNYKLILASNCNNDIARCLDSEGTLLEWNDETGEGVEILNTFGEEDGLVPLLYSQGINGESTISVNTTSVTFELSDSIDYLKAVFLVSYGNGSGYVLAYAINGVPLEILDDQLILNLHGMIWGTHYIVGE